jgi:predicted PurR-regulated permease PerM
VNNQYPLLDVVNVAAALASIVLAVVAIGLAVYFYVKGRVSEGQASSVLSQIQNQIGTLDKLSGKMLDRLTRASIESRPEQEAILTIISALRQIPESLANGPRGSVAQGVSPSEWIAALIAAYYYSSMVNFLLQSMITTVEEGTGIYKNFEGLVEASYRDFRYLEDLLSDAGQSTLEGNRLRPVYEETIRNWRPWVRSAFESYKTRHANSAG